MAKYMRDIRKSKQKRSLRLFKPSRYRDIEKAIEPLMPIYPEPFVGDQWPYDGYPTWQFDPCSSPTYTTTGINTK